MGNTDLSAANEETRLTSSIISPNVKLVPVARNDPYDEETLSYKEMYAGLSREALMKYADDPLWVRIRMACFVGFWLIIAALIAASIGIVWKAPKCYPPMREWWQEGVVYSVLTPAFKDGGNPQRGVGNLKGIRSKLDYFKELGVNTVWLSPVYKSPMVDFGYDIEDFTAIDPIFGTLDDFKNLIGDMKSKGLKLVLDFVPNHSSDKHVWFQKSIDRQDPYTDYYVWAPGKGVDKQGKPVPPNNWISVFGGSAWEYNDKRKEFYLHQFTKEQPDLNFRNESVIEEMLSVMKFWLDLGVDGFRVDAVPHLLEDPQLRDEPSKNSSAKAGSYDSLRHIYTTHLPETLHILRKFRELVDEYGGEKLLMAEVYGTIKETVSYYGNESQPLANFPFNFLFIAELNNKSTAQNVYDTVNLWLRNMPRGAWPNWVLGNHDKSRVATRFGRDLIDGLHMITMLLPGTPVTYYGEEIGMEDTPVKWVDTKDPAGKNAGEEHYTEFTRDPPRTPMQWNKQKNSGFSDAEDTWLPVNQNYISLNVEEQEKAVASHLKVYQALVELRKTQSILYGDLETKVLENRSVFAFTRLRKDTPNYVVAVNFADKDVLVDLTAFESVSLIAEVCTQSTGFKHKHIKIGHKIQTDAVPLGPKEGIVLRYIRRVK